jgi:hypothetical protein
MNLTTEGNGISESKQDYPRLCRGLAEEDTETHPFGDQRGERSGRELCKVRSPKDTKFTQHTTILTISS